MSEDTEKPRFREHLREIRGALGGLGKDVELDVTHAPRVVKEGTKNAFAKAAGVRRGPMPEWGDSEGSESK
jgi:hypothetical protein